MYTVPIKRTHFLNRLVSLVLLVILLVLCRLTIISNRQIEMSVDFVQIQSVSIRFGARKSGTNSIAMRFTLLSNVDSNLDICPV